MTVNLVPRFFLFSNMVAAGKMTLGHSRWRWRLYSKWRPRRSRERIWEQDCQRQSKSKIECEGNFIKQNNSIKAQIPAALFSCRCHMGKQEDTVDEVGITGAIARLRHLPLTSSRLVCFSSLTLPPAKAVLTQGRI